MTNSDAALRPGFFRMRMALGGVRSKSLGDTECGIPRKGNRVRAIEHVRIVVVEVSHDEHLCSIQACLVANTVAK